MSFAIKGQRTQFRVTTGGYECVEVNGQKVIRAITPRYLAGIDYDAQGLGHPVWAGSAAHDGKPTLNLHRDFVALKPNPESIVGFAYKHGLLGLRGCLQWRRMENGENCQQDMEPLIDWIGHARQLRKLVTLYDSVGTDAAKQYVQRVANGHFIVFPGEHGVTSKAHVSDPAGELTDLDEAILDYIRAEVNVWLEGTVSASLVTEPRHKAQYTAEDADRRTGLEFLPNSLLGAIYLSFAKEIAEMRVRKTCRCGERFWQKRDKRSDTQYCTPQCRHRTNVAAWRKKKKQSA